MTAVPSPPAPSTARRRPQAVASLGPSALLASRRVPDPTARDVCVSGPPGMTTAVLRTEREPGVRKRQIHHERFSLAG
ncbi:ferredoxin-NADP reductase [Streptomyces calvus]|uniref:hypothetical protein n=1 Tax=Streptomyces calvus TaxID=67282 RepID=UPI0035189405